MDKPSPIKRATTIPCYIIIGLCPKPAIITIGWGYINKSYNPCDFGLL